MKPLFDIRAREVYLDNAATTMVLPEVADAMIPYLSNKYGNPETNHHMGLEARDAVDEAREKVADLLGASNPERVFFTSGGTESNNWALRSGMLGCNDDCLVVSAVEHKSVLATANWMDTFGFCALNKLPVNDKCVVNLDVLMNLKDSVKVRLVSIQHANNEVGTIQDIKRAASICKELKAAFHVDACQTFGKFRFSVEDLGADMVSVSAHKLHGPMGVGALWIGDGFNLDPFMTGGKQQGGMRAGTLAVHDVVGFGKAAELAWSGIDQAAAKVSSLRQRLIGELTTRHKAVVNGNASPNCVPGILSVSFPGAEADMLAAVLSKKYGICVGRGSACCRGEPSHVLTAMGLNKAQCQSTLRISMSRMTTDQEIGVLVFALDVALREEKDRGLA